MTVCPLGRCTEVSEVTEELRKLTDSSMEFHGRQAQGNRRQRVSSHSQKRTDLDVIRNLGPEASSSDTERALESLIQRWHNEPGRVTKLLQNAQGSGVVSGILRSMQSNQIEVNVWHSNAAAGSLVEKYSWQKAVHLCAAMGSAALLPDVLTATVSARAHMEGGNWLLSLKHLHDMKAMRADIRAYTKSFLAPCTTRNDWQLSIWYLRNSASLNLQPDSVSLAEVLGACKRGRCWPKALQLLSMQSNMQSMAPPVAASQRRARPSPVLVANSVLDVLATGNRWREAASVFRRMSHARLSWDHISANTVINAVPQWQQSLSCLYVLVDQELEPDIVTHGSAIPEGPGGQWQQGLNFLAMMHRCGSAPNFLIWNCFMNTLSAEPRWLQAFALLGRLPQFSVQCDRITFAAGMLAAQSASLWQTSVTLASSMLQESIKHDAMSYCVFSRASSSWQGACSMLQSFRWQVRADMITQNSHLDMFSKSSDWKCALGMSTGMQTAGMLLDEVSCCALISACQTPQTWQWAQRLLDEVRLLQLSLDTASFKAATRHEAI